MGEFCWDARRFWHFIDTKALYSDAEQAIRVEWNPGKDSPPTEKITWVRDTEREKTDGIANYAKFHEKDAASVTLDEVRNSEVGLGGWVTNRPVKDAEAAAAKEAAAEEAAAEEAAAAEAEA